MTLIHGVETPYGTPLRATTWVSRLRRRTLSTREVRVHSGDDLVAAATQEWVHVDSETLRPTRGAEATAAAFPAVDREPSVKLPEFVSTPGTASTFAFRMWQTWADPLGHANHPAYVDWCDEATAKRCVEGGIDPTNLQPMAEQVHFRDSVLPGEEVTVRTERVGVVGDDAVVLKHSLETPRGPAAEATTIRGLAGSQGREWVASWD